RLATTLPLDVMSNLIVPIGCYLAIAFLSLLNQRCYDVLKMRVIPALKKRISTHLVFHLMGQSHRYFQSNFAGDLASCIKEIARGVGELVQLMIDCFFSHGLAI